jgi:FAD:protein FMN transferase
MTCEFEVCFPAGHPENGTSLAIEALDEVESLEEQLSYFRPTSHISRINRLAAEEPVELDADLFNLVVLAMQLNRETDGGYDITSAPLWEAWGFARRGGQIPSDPELADARLLVGGHLVELDAERRTIRFHKPGVRINLGSIGKGYALDVCARRLLSQGMTDFLLHGGQSSVLARGSSLPADISNHIGKTSGGVPLLGTSSAERNPPSWEIGIRHLGPSGRRLGILRLVDRALGTSTTQFQFFRHAGRRYGHILDPRTGRPAEGVLSATATAPTAAEADALSTAFFVIGPEAAQNYCQLHPEIGMVMACPGRTGGALEIHTAGFQPGDIKF